MNTDEILHEGFKRAFKGQLKQNNNPVSDSNPLPVAVKNSSSSPIPVQIYGTAPDREISTVLYRVKSGSGGLTIGHVVSATRVLDVSNSVVSQVGNTYWYNETTNAELSSPPPADTIEIVQSGFLTNAELRASPVGVVGTIRGPISDSFTRPADTAAYAANDAIQNATSTPATRKFASIFPANGGTGYISIAAIVRNTSMTARLRVHLFSSDPATKAVDNAAFSVATGDEAVYLGYVDLDAMNTGTAASSVSKAIAVTGPDVFYQIQTLDAFTPASGTNYLLKATIDSNV